ncbi:MAG: zinc-binding dehydrogenase, partial [Pseudomonadota bacterium]
QEDMIAAIEASNIKPVLDKDFALDQIAEAFAHQASQQHFGKITLSI